MNADAGVFWDPHRYSHALPLKAEKGLPGSARVDFNALPCDVTILRARHEEHHVLLAISGRSLQLVVNTRTVSKQFHLTTDALWPQQLGKARLAALDALNALVQTGGFPARYCPPDPRSRRLSIILQALDGALAGARQRDIAVALFGNARVDRDWADPGNHLRDHVRRAVRRGRYLMTKGYRDFLR